MTDPLSRETATERTFVVVHGAWSGGWSWRRMRPLMRAAGVELITPTLTGLGERAHLASPHVDLETHIADILGVLHMEDLRDVTLIGFSYGGMVATGAADRSRDRVARLIYLDAFVPENGKSLHQMLGRSVAADADWRVEPNPIPADTSEADARWIMESSGNFHNPAQLLRRDPASARLYPLHPSLARRSPAILGAARAPRRLALCRDRRKPQPAHYCAPTPRLHASRT